MHYLCIRYQQNLSMKNPFLTYGYAGPAYFCDRVEETKRLTTLLVNGNHIALMSPRRMGKTGLIHHCFAQKEIADHYYTFIVDIYATKSLSELTFALGKNILSTLKSSESKVWTQFLKIVGSLRTGITLDEFGKPSWNLEIGDIKNPQISLDEIFDFLSKADKPCLVAIDEFQTIADYKEKNVEAVLRTYIQKCNNARFVFSGSRRKMMGEIFNSPSRPFYQSATTMSLSSIPLPAYTDYIQYHFRSNDKSITPEAISEIYNRFEGTTWYIQKVANELFTYTGKGETVSSDNVLPAICRIIGENSDTYMETLYRLTSKQKMVLIALAKSGPNVQVTSAQFINKYKLASSSSVQKALEALLEKEIVTNHLGTFSIYDYFFSLWIRENL